MLGFVTVVLAVLIASTGGHVSRFDGALCSSVKWTGGTYNWPCDVMRTMYKNAGNYIPKNNIAIRSVIVGHTAILALPRYKPGVPATLAKLSLNPGDPPSLTPFPCWAMQEEGNCRALQNVVDIYLDHQNIVWALDTGIVNTEESMPQYKCPPKVVAINALTGKVVKVITLSGLAKRDSRLQYVIADYSKDGRAFIYVSDAATGSIIVHDISSGRGYRVILPPEVSQGAQSKSILYMSLLQRSDGSNCVIFTYLGGNRVFSMKSSALQHGRNDGKIHDIGAKPHDKKIIILGTDNGSALFFRYEGQSTVYRWDILQPFAESNFVRVHCGDDCSFPTHVMPDYSKNRMRVLKSNFPDFFQGTVGCGVTQTLSLM